MGPVDMSPNASIFGWAGYAQIEVDQRLLDARLSFPLLSSSDLIITALCRWTDILERKKKIFASKIHLAFRKWTKFFF